MIQNIEYLKEHFVDHGFAECSTAYVATNEDLRNVLTCMPKDTNRALTVTASGDHPMFAKLYGAKYVDTFDISFNARLIMDIKTKALSLLDYEKYCELLKNLYTAEDIINTKNMTGIIKTLMPFEQKYIAEMHGKRLFSKENEHMLHSLPTESEF